MQKQTKKIAVASTFLLLFAVTTLFFVFQPRTIVEKVAVIAFPTSAVAIVFILRLLTRR